MAAGDAHVAHAALLVVVGQAAASALLLLVGQAAAAALLALCGLLLVVRQDVAAPTAATIVRIAAPPPAALTPAAPTPAAVAVTVVASRVVIMRLPLLLLLLLGGERCLPRRTLGHCVRPELHSSGGWCARGKRSPRLGSSRLAC